MTNLPTTAVAEQKRSVASVMPLMDPGYFEHMQRVGSMLALSPLFPDHLRKGEKATAIANGVLCVNMALRLNEDVLTVAQNIYFVGGKPGWSASYMIGKANQSGTFREPIDWDVDGAGESFSVTAYAMTAATGKRVSVTCDMKMAEAEGWTKNAKYRSMPEQMLRYRSATALIRLYCPQVMIGMPTTIELETSDMRDVTPREAAHAQARATAQRTVKAETENLDTAVEVVDSETGEVTESTPAEAEGKPEAAEPDKQDAPSREALQNMAQSVLDDLRAAKSRDDADEILSFYAAVIAKLTAHAPDLLAMVEGAARTAGQHEPEPETQTA